MLLSCVPNLELPCTDCSNEIVDEFEDRGLTSMSEGDGDDRFQLNRAVF
jgi:hypothetical protein